MKTEVNELLTFHLTGERPEGAKNDPATLGLCPALLSGYRDLTRIRHDYPLVLVNGRPDQPVKSLSGIVNATLQAVAPRGIAGERMRKNLLSLEGEIRALAFQRGRGSLSELWGQAADELLSRDGLSAEDREKNAVNNMINNEMSKKSSFTADRFESASKKGYDNKHNNPGTK